MLQHFFYLLRPPERQAAPLGPADMRPHGASQPPTGAFLAELLRAALAQHQAESRGGSVPSSPNEPPPQPGPEEAEPADGKVIRLVPRRPAAEPPPPDDDDPGPAAA